MKTVTIGALALLPVGVALADEADRRELGAHEHGHSVLNIAIEGDRIEMELMAPGMDIVGFEHAAETDEQASAVEAAEATLSDPLALFVLPADAACAVATAVVELAAEDEHAEHAGEDEHERQAEEGEHEEHAEDAMHEEHAEHEGEESHNEFHAEYGIACRSTGDLGSIEFAFFFERFPGAKEIEVTVITEHGQTSYEVERDSPRIDLKGLI